MQTEKKEPRQEVRKIFIEEYDYTTGGDKMVLSKVTHGLMPYLKHYKIEYEMHDTFPQITFFTLRSCLAYMVQPKQNRHALQMARNHLS